jgi:hypothetical protein
VDPYLVRFEPTLSSTNALGVRDKGCSLFIITVV